MATIFRSSIVPIKSVGRRWTAFGPRVKRGSTPKGDKSNVVSLRGRR